MTGRVMQNVATFTTPDEARLAVSRLESAGIGAVIPDDLTLSQNYVFAAALGGVRVQVPDEDLADSRTILGLTPVETGVLLCPHCHSADVGVRPLGAMQGLAMTFNLPWFSGKITADCRACGGSFQVPRAG
ncbi:MAG: hypothetical protein RL324_1512 [Verrucomicrobiota bacterium]